VSNQVKPIATFGLDDDALVTFGPPVAGGVSFHDEGYLSVTQINGLTLGNKLGGGLFIQYAGNGVQAFNAQGQPTTANYTSLDYKLEAYTGTASFARGAGGTPIETGAKDLVTLATGSLLNGELAFTPTGGVTGEIETTFNIGGRTFGQLDINVVHSASNLGQTSAGGLTISGGFSTASILPFQHFG